MGGAEKLTRYYSDAEIIKLSLILYPEDMCFELRQDAQVLMMNIHKRNPVQKIMFGEMMAFELLYKLGRLMNREFPLDGAD